MTERHNITVVGLGYVGMSLSALLARQRSITALDIDEEHVARVNAGRPTVAAALMADYMANEELSLVATTSPSNAYVDAGFVIVATPTDYDPEKNHFDTSSVEAVIEQARQHNSTATIVIKSTIPVGLTEELKQKLNEDRLLFSPEFLREGQALHHNLHPSRIIVGGAGDKAVKRSDSDNLCWNLSRITCPIHTPMELRQHRCLKRANSLHCGLLKPILNSHSASSQKFLV